MQIIKDKGTVSGEQYKSRRLEFFGEFLWERKAIQPNDLAVKLARRGAEEGRVQGKQRFSSKLGKWKIPICSGKLWECVEVFIISLNLMRKRNIFKIYEI